MNVSFHGIRFYESPLKLTDEAADVVERPAGVAFSVLGEFIDAKSKERRHERERKLVGIRWLQEQHGYEALRLTKIIVTTVNTRRVLREECQK